MDATRPWRLEGVLRRYPWGSRTAIPELLGREPDGEPQAELWLGAHPSAPSRVYPDAAGEALDACIRRDPEALLGPAALARFGAELPFLFKLLAAAEPLSIQAHPSRMQAKRGFERENAAGLALDAENRCYRDPNPKPELVCALGRFRALNRFRHPREIAAAIAALSIPETKPFLELLGGSPPGDALRRFFGAWMQHDPGSRTRLVSRVADAAGRRPEDPACAEVVRLAERHPGDPGILAPLVLHLVELDPGEAMFLPAGQLHAYLDGVALEVMASSDNVLRGGLTTKHVDVPELLATLCFDPGDPGILRRELLPGSRDAARCYFPTPAEEFRLEVLSPRSGLSVRAAGHGPRILLSIGGPVRVSRPAAAGSWTVPGGGSLFVPHAVGEIRVEGEATVYVVSLGDPGGAGKH